MFAAVLLAAACVPPKEPPPPPPDTYVALGDSFSAGTFIANQVPPQGCFKSDHSYPRLVAPSTNLPKLVDMSCSGATTAHMTQSQTLLFGDPNPPQFDALDNMTGLVTITIGGNDVEYWSTIADACKSTSAAGTPCQDQFVVNGQDTISQRIAAAAPKVAGVLDGIHQRAPRAKVFVLAYEAIFPEFPLAPGGPEGCHPQLPYAPGDVPYLRAKQREINAMIQQQAAVHGATFVDTYSASIGHDACRTPAVRWVEPTSVSGVGFALHPNVAGMTGAKDALLALL
jgi:lysophospholipase L1-like esterase